ncbi:hypothetical protein M434DRAFT_328867 [Hypoxylon sp. CO27-5]|nr:hypothetical protein M434DRAFT_328867 [Hypoxylon sp. CO27-5]
MLEFFGPRLLSSATLLSLTPVPQVRLCIVVTASVSCQVDQEIVNFCLYGVNEAQETYHACSSSSRNTRAIGLVKMELMQEYVDGSTNVGIDDLERWPYDLLAVDFLSATESASEINQLVEHPLLRLPWLEDVLREVVVLVNDCVARYVKYLEYIPLLSMELEGGRGGGAKGERKTGRWMIKTRKGGMES